MNNFENWVKEHSDQVDLVYLLLYSPEQNPDKSLNPNLKQAVAEKPPARNTIQLKKQIASHIKRIQNLPLCVKSYFKNLYVQYAR